MRRNLLGLLICGALAPDAFSLDPSKSLTQYTRTDWTQREGLPQDAINAITQTNDGYLWLGTDDGLARFDGTDFTVFNKDNGSLPSNSVTALASGTDGALWIGTTNGLTYYKAGRFQTYTIVDGLPTNNIGDLYMDQAGILLIVAGGSLSEVIGANRIKTLVEAKDVPFALRAVCRDDRGILWMAGVGGFGRWTGGKVVSEIDPAELNHNVIIRMVSDKNNNLWMAGNRGIVRYTADRKIRTFDTRDGLPEAYIRSVRVDRNGVLWAGTGAGFARLMHGRFTTLVGPDGRDRDLVRIVYEDREGDLWIGGNNGLTRLRDDIFTAYGKHEGLPGDDPNTLYQDRRGQIWVGFHNNGLMLLSPKGNRLFTTRDGLPSNEIFSIREARDGQLLIGTREGLVRARGFEFNTYMPEHKLGQPVVFDSLEDSAGRIWLATSAGLGELQGHRLRIAIEGEGSLNPMVSLLEGADGAIWAGTYRGGLWRLQGNQKRRFTIKDGLSSDQIRSLYQDPDGRLWIATFDGGLNVFDKGTFLHFTTQDGLLSDNISNVLDDGQSLWLSTTRGICRIARRQLVDFIEHKIRSLQPVNYGVEDGLRSALCAPGYPVARGGSITSDGRLWFVTSRGLAVIDPRVPRPSQAVPKVQIADVTVDGKKMDLSQIPRLHPEIARIRIRFTSPYLSAPERVQYSHKLLGLEPDWISTGNQRETDYNNLPRGTYRFLVRATLLGGPISETAYDFERLPAFFETIWFRGSCAIALLASIWGAYKLRVHQLRDRFASVLEERARLAREIHDTLTQSFVGISSQLDALASELPEDLNRARRYLNIARRMARHSITEARRSIEDLRASVLEGQSLAAALGSSVHTWTVTSGVLAEVNVSGETQLLPKEHEQQLLRITQEAVTNAIKHARASKVSVCLHIERFAVCLRIVDNGRGFEEGNAFISAAGHFGLIGMRERAERLGGEFKLKCRPGEGTQVEVNVPIK